MEGDWIAHDFAFKSGEKLAELRLHYTTLGNACPRRRGPREATPYIIMHGTGGSGRAFLGAGFGGELFGKDQPLDAADSTSSCPTTSATANPASRATACA